MTNFFIFAVSFYFSLKSIEWIWEKAFYSYKWKKLEIELEKQRQYWVGRSFGKNRQEEEYIKLDMIQHVTDVMDRIKKGYL